MFKKLFIIILFSYTVTAWTNLAFAQNTTSGSYDYTTAGVGTEIKKYLCAPSDPDPKQTNLTGSQVEYSAVNNKASGDLYNCINRLYRFAIVTAAVVGVFFIVIAGYLYMGAGGNQESIDKAKSILASTVTSLVILFAGYLLLKTLNPDLVMFRPIQPPSVTLQPAYIPGFVPSQSLPGAPGSRPGYYNLAGYNISPYATDKNHEVGVANIYKKLLALDLSTPEKIKAYMDRSARGVSGNNSPLTGEMVMTSANNRGVDFRVMMAIMEQDSHYGSHGARAINNFNPGNVGNTDGGANRNFGNWANGVDAVAVWLNNHRA